MFWLFVFEVLVVGVAIRFLLRAYLTWSTSRTLDEFLDRFPGACPVCSYERFGVREGYRSRFDPPEHPCPEKAGDR